MKRTVTVEDAMDAKGMKGQSNARDSYTPDIGGEMHDGPHDLRGEDGPVKGRAWHGFKKGKR